VFPPNLIFYMEDLDLVIPVTEMPTPGELEALRTPAPSFDDSMILAAMTDVLDDIGPRRLSLTDALSAVVAQAVQALGYIERGPDLVRTVVAFLIRHLRMKPIEERKPEEYGGGLVALQHRMAEATNPSDKISAGLALGDRGIWYSSGRGGRRVRDLFSPEYIRQVALSGYYGAVVLAERHPLAAKAPQAGSVSFLVENPEGRFGCAVEVVERVFPRQDPDDRYVIHFGDQAIEVPRSATPWYVEDVAGHLLS
jgi:hypothetical protein